MSRKKEPIRQIRIDRLNELIKNENYEKKHVILANGSNIMPTTLSNLLNGKTGISSGHIEDIINFVNKNKNPGSKYRIEWLLGNDDYATNSDYLKHLMMENRTIANELSKAFSLYIALNGYDIKAVAPVSDKYKEVPKNDEDYLELVEEFEKAANEGYIISNDNGYVKLSLDEFKAMANEVCDYVGFRLEHMTKPVQSISLSTSEITQNNNITPIEFKKRNPEDIKKHLKETYNLIKNDPNCPKETLEKLLNTINTL